MKMKMKKRGWRRRRSTKTTTKEKTISLKTNNKISVLTCQVLTFLNSNQPNKPKLNLILCKPKLKQETFQTKLFSNEIFFCQIG